MDLRDHEKSLVVDFERVKALEAASIAVTGLDKGVVVACGGITPFLSGNAEIWLIPSIYFKEHAHTAVPEIMRWLFEVRENLQLNRMETSCIDDDLHTRFMEALGFECEGLKRKFYMGIDYKMWGRVWDYQ